MTSDDDRLQSIEFRLEQLQQSMALLLRQHRGDRAERLRDYVMEAGRVTTKEAKKVLGLKSRGNVLNHMDRLGHEPGFTYREGQSRGPTSILVFDHARKIREQREAIQSLLAEKKEACLYDIMVLLNVDLPEARLVVKDFLSTTSAYVFDDPRIREVTP